MASKIITLSLAEWRQEGEKRFGADPLKWRFVCPACGHIQSAEDFRPFKDQGATADSARFLCIGRYSGARPNAGLSGTGREGGPCNYTSGGLLNLNPVTVLDGARRYSSFAFAEPTAPDERRPEQP